MGIDGATAGQQLPFGGTSLEYFSYAGCRSHSKGTNTICNGLRDTVELCPGSNSNFGCQQQYLNLDDCPFHSGEENDDGSIDSLCTALGGCQFLTVYVFSLFLYGQ
jgi:hypothetical protein